MTGEQRSHLLIYCDGGFGNRLNALFSGLALAHALRLPHTVFWPRNNWCQAGYTDLFLPGPTIDERTLSALAGTLNDCVPLLHDSMGAQTLRMPFASAYAYTSMDDFAQRALSSGQAVFYYPALMPAWIPQDQIVQAMRGCVYQPDIRAEVIGFIQEKIGQPFYGLHLRRTDLGVGYSDDEVQEIVQTHPQALFFVCSDDPMAEAKAAVQPNVVSRKKSAYVDKRHGHGGWTAATADDDGRIYHSNIDRTAASVREAVIDLLVLAHSEIVGFSGSTFQNMARLIGSHAPLVPLGRPALAIAYGAMNTWQRMLQANTLSAGQCVELGLELAGKGQDQRAIALEKLALEQYASTGADSLDFLVLHYNLAVHLIHSGKPFEAVSRLQAALVYFPGHAQLETLLATASQRAGVPSRSPVLSPLPAPHNPERAARCIKTYMQWHLGDNLLHLHFLRKLAQRYPELTFEHSLNPAYISQCQDLVDDLPQIRLLPLRAGETPGIDGWKGADGFFFAHDRRFQFGALYVDLFARLARKMGLESPIRRPDDLLFDYPAICQDKGLGSYDVLLINSVPLSEQFKSYQESHFVALAQALRARGLRVITTHKLADFPCTLEQHLSVTDIANLSLRARYFIAVCTGAMWPSMNRFNQSIHQFRIILNDHETIDFGSRVTMCRDAALMVPMVLERLDGNTDLGRAGGPV